MDPQIIKSELEFKAIRSSGAGGQHVNKVSSKVVASLNIALSEGLSEEEKSTLLDKLASKLTRENVLILAADDSRSQFRNKAIVTQRILELLTLNLKQDKPRKATKPTFGALQRKLKNKAIQSEKKERRKPPKME